MLERIDHVYFEQVFQIMDESFPTDEYRPYDEQKKLLDNPYYRIYVYKQQDEVAAFFCVWTFDDFAFVEHFAVKENYRSGGIGSKLIQALVEKLNLPICLEVELPEEEMAKRRIGFYERNGLVFNDYEYMQPAISKGKKEIPLALMTYPKNISKEVFEHYKETLYREVYKVMK